MDKRYLAPKLLCLDFLQPLTHLTLSVTRGFMLWSGLPVYDLCCLSQRDPPPKPCLKSSDFLSLSLFCDFLKFTKSLSSPLPLHGSLPDFIYLASGCWPQLLRQNFAKILSTVCCNAGNFCYECLFPLLLKKQNEKKK